MAAARTLGEIQKAFTSPVHVIIVGDQEVIVDNTNTIVVSDISPTQLQQNPSLTILDSDNQLIPPFESGDSVNSQKEIKGEKTTPLIYAVRTCKSLKLIQALLNAGADLAAKDGDNRTAVFYIFNPSAFIDPTWRDSVIKEFMSLITDTPVELSASSHSPSATALAQDVIPASTIDKNKQPKKKPDSTPSNHQSATTQTTQRPPSSTDSSHINMRMSVPITRLDLAHLIPPNTKKITKDVLERAYSAFKKDEADREIKEKEHTKKTKESDNSSSPSFLKRNYQEIIIFGTGSTCAVFLWHASAVSTACVFGFIGGVIILTFALPRLAAYYNYCGLFGNSGEIKAVNRDQVPRQLHTFS